MVGTALCAGGALAGDELQHLRLLACIHHTLCSQDLDGTKTYVAVVNFADRVFITVSQLKTLGTLVRTRAAPRFLLLLQVH